ncbi:protein moonraker isoform X4 [Trichosurus vulpecula]|uniref:protein moonraker isoform X4 n=1 Tax=Trichosurus vulpecula TaxID=9337 RepID=UPI00186B0C72|nr:protein moonraker isoform X4 [Trichosurus vulpecula]
MGPSNLHTQLQFNRNVPSLPDNLAVRYSGPRPIVIEKLRPPDRASAPASAPGLLEGPRHRPSVPFSVVSEEKLSLAVRLAKRDVKRKQLAELVSGRVPHSQPLSARKFSPSRSELTKKPRGPLPGRQRPSQGETAARAKVYLSRDPRSDSSPPMRDRGPQPCALKVGHPQSVLELQRLQKELSACLQSIEGLATKDRLEEGLDPDEAKRSRVRRQEQAARTARTLYALQQQVKELQEELDKLSPNRIKHTKKSRAMSRLAAAHRGAIRALRMFVSQFTDSKEQAVSERYRELGDLIRQLSICSARLDTDPSVLAVVLDLLQQIEELDSLLERKQSLGKIKKRFPGVRSQSPLGFPMALERSISTSPVRERKPLVAKEKLPLEGRRPVVRKLLEDEHPSFALSPLYQILGEGLKGQPEEDLASSDQKAAFKIGPTSTKAKAMKKRPLPTAGPLRRRGVETAAKSEQSFHKVERLRPHQAQGKDHRFQRMTVSFRLKRNQPPVKDHRTPWIPPNPTSPLASPKWLAWLDAESARRLKELDKLKARELADIRRLSASTSELADKVEKAVLERLKPLLDQAKEADAPLGDSLSVHEAMAQAPEKALPRKELPDCTPRDLAPDLHCKTRTQVSQPEAMGFQDEDSPDLWTMMRRMEEMERYQEAVRRRFSQMVYADLDFGTERGRSNGKVPAVDERPRPPNPIQLTKRAGSGEPQVNILLEKPLDEKYFEESMDMEERGEKGAPLRPASSAAPQQPEGSILLSVPREMLRNLGNYQDSYQQYLRTISHESIGTFNPWIIVESLAEELVEEALEDVTAELQDVCEDYAEAVFTSEFLEPSK